MPNIYEENKKYYIKNGDQYNLCEVLYKYNTIVFVPTNYIVSELKNPTIYKYKDLRDILLNE